MNTPNVTTCGHANRQPLKGTASLLSLCHEGGSREHCASSIRLDGGSVKACIKLGHWYKRMMWLSIKGSQFKVSVTVWLHWELRLCEDEKKASLLQHQESVSVANPVVWHNCKASNIPPVVQPYTMTSIFYRALPKASWNQLFKILLDRFCVSGVIFFASAKPIFKHLTWWFHVLLTECPPWLCSFFWSREGQMALKLGTRMVNVSVQQRKRQTKGDRPRMREMKRHMIPHRPKSDLQGGWTGEEIAAHQSKPTRGRRGTVTGQKGRGIGAASQARAGGAPTWSSLPYTLCPGLEKEQRRSCSHMLPNLKTDWLQDGGFSSGRRWECKKKSATNHLEGAHSAVSPDRCNSFQTNNQTLLLTEQISLFIWLKQATTNSWTTDLWPLCPTNIFFFQFESVHQPHVYPKKKLFVSSP